MINWWFTAQMAELSFPSQGYTTITHLKQERLPWISPPWRTASGPGGINGISLYLDKSRDPERVVDELKARFIGQPLRIRRQPSLERRHS